MQRVNRITAGGLANLLTGILFVFLGVWEVAFLAFTVGILLLFVAEWQQGRAKAREMKREVEELRALLRSASVPLGNGTQSVLMVDPTLKQNDTPVVSFRKLTSAHYDLI